MIFKLPTVNNKKKELKTEASTKNDFQTANTAAISKTENTSAENSKNHCQTNIETTPPSKKPN